MISIAYKSNSTTYTIEKLVHPSLPPPHPDGVLTRRFHIGAINACSLTDGKLVLWLQKQYSSSTTGKLHFITPPHLEEPVNVAKSSPLLAQT